MDIKNVGEFAAYCQQNAHDEGLSNTVKIAEVWTDLSVALGQQYGGPSTNMEYWVQEAYSRMAISEAPMSHSTLTQCHEILTRFWKHGDVFDDWFKSKVIVVTQKTPEQ
jgi:hypothetical protein